MTVQPIHLDQTFFAPAFRLVLADRELQGEAIRDVVDVSYTDDLENLDSFEFTLNDWDPVRRLPKYSSPLDENGDVLRLESGEPVPNFEPGAAVALHLGYHDQGELPLVMRGEVVSLTPRFPASGAPTLKVRAVNALHRLLDEKRPGSYEGTNFEIARAIARDMDIAITTPEPGDEPALERVVFQDQYPIVALLNLARRTGCRLWLDEEGPTLRMERSPVEPATYELEWGKSLIQFTPTLTTRGQVSKVTVHGVDLTRSGDDRKISGEATWDDLEVDGESLDTATEGELRSAIRTREEDIYHEPVTSAAEAEARARSYLRAMALGLVTGDGSTIGTPDLRAGRAVRLKGLGRRFNGTYTVTASTHAIAGSGYVTKFKARKEIVR
jgi:hypothetical protein